MAADLEQGVWRGRSVARVFVAPDGTTVLVGKSAKDNDVLSRRMARPYDFWFHAAGYSGAHVVVRNPEKLKRLSRETRDFAAALAAGYSGGHGGGRVAVHQALCGDVSKPRGLAAGKVVVKRFQVVEVRPSKGKPLD